MTYVLRMDENIPVDLKKYPEVKIMLDVANHYNGHEFESIDDVNVSILRKAATALLKRQQMSVRFGYYSLRLVPIGDSGNYRLMCITEKVESQCGFGILEVIASNDA